MSKQSIRKIVIVGGGTSGWMTGAALVHFFGKQGCEIQLIESDAIGTVGVGEATLPHLRFFNQTLGIDEQEFMQATQATYKMGIEFSNWGQLGDVYIHPFGDYGRSYNDVGFHHYWTKLKQMGDTSPIDIYSLPVVAAARNKFAFPSSDERSILSTYSYAFHLDATLYAKYLRNYSEMRGLVRHEGKVIEVIQSSVDGRIEKVLLDNGLHVEGDLFIDCSGFRGLLIEQTLKTGYEDWSEYLPCNRAVAIPCERNGNLLPYTKARAQTSGWQWRIPLQHRTGNGYVYCSDYISDDEACGSLLSNLDGKPTAEPNFLRFTTGKRKEAWNKNCVAIGLAGGFLEPLESTSIYLIQIAITKLIEFFPDKDFDEATRAEYNRQMDIEYTRVKDFLILHYHATRRTDTSFWNRCRTMEIPESLRDKMKLFKERGYVVQYQGGLFLEPSWVAVYLGQGVVPSCYDLRVNRISDSDLQIMMKNIRDLVARAAADLPLHSDFLQWQREKLFNACEAPRPSLSLYGSR